MILAEKIKSLPNWSISKSNRWADYIELSCLCNPDHMYSVHDFLDHYTDVKGGDLKRGYSEHSIKVDRLTAEFEYFFELLNFRFKTLHDYYPFDFLDRRCIILKDELTEEHMFYLFLLLSSNLTFFDASDSIRHKLTHAFEDICCTLLSNISSPFADTFTFGTSRNISGDTDSPFKGNLKERLNNLAAMLCTSTTKTFDRNKDLQVPSGDGGIDLVSYISLDKMPFIPVVFAQCSCSYDKWVDKQFSIHVDIWGKRFEDLAPYMKFSFVPFYYRNTIGEFENFEKINTCLIDRHRIFKILKNDHNIIKIFKSHSVYKDLFEIIDSTVGPTSKISA